MQDYNETSEKIAERMSKIKRKIGIVSGKGGVGKSVLTALLACGLASKGKKVGLLDADITGPSIPRLFGIRGKPAIANNSIIPPTAKNGLKLMSANLLLEEEDAPAIFRGPLLANAIRQFLSDVEWGELDYLFIDFPPGTGDIPLTIMQSIQLDGIIFVTSPQKLAFMIVKKTINMAKEIKVPVIGLVENMAFLKCPNCNEMLYPFGKPEAEKTAKEAGLNLIGRLPIDQEISRLSDEGKIDEYKDNSIEQIIAEIEKYAEESK
jgi:Mrp family chromosome partitioning ATPase